jgi:hypothetical protein
MRNFWVTPWTKNPITFYISTTVPLARTTGKLAAIPNIIVDDGAKREVST